jgi:hypothetical protein
VGDYYTDVPGGQGGPGGSSSWGKILPWVGAGLSLLQAYQGAKGLSQQRKIAQQQLAQIQQERMLGRLLGQTGAAGNPFSPVYRGAFQQLT